MIMNRKTLVLIYLTVLVHSELVTKRKGETVVLHVDKPDTLKTYIWSYAPSNPLKVIAVVTDNVQTVVNGTRFGTRMCLDVNTSNLLIQNLTIEDSGAFQIQILTQNGTLDAQFNLKVTENAVRIHALEGTNAMLSTTLEYLDPLHRVFWTKGDFSGKVIAKLENNIITYDPELQDHLLLDDQTGDLTITNILKHLSGVYCVRLMYNKDPHIMIQYEVHVYSPVSAPKLLFEKHISDSTKSWSCRVNCSVQNSEDLVLKWLRGGEVLNQTSVSNLSCKVVLPLNVLQTQEEFIYTCQAENPISKQAVIFNTTYWCPQKDSSWGKMAKNIAIGVSISVVILCGVAFYFCYRKFRGPTACSREPREEHPAAPKHCQLSVNT